MTSLFLFQRYYFGITLILYSYPCELSRRHFHNFQGFCVSFPRCYQSVYYFLSFSPRTFRIFHFFERIFIFFVVWSKSLGVICIWSNPEFFDPIISKLFFLFFFFILNPGLIVTEKTGLKPILKINKNKKVKRMPQIIEFRFLSSKCRRYCKYHFTR